MFRQEEYEALFREQIEKLKAKRNGAGNKVNED